MTKPYLFLRSRWTAALALILALAGTAPSADQAKKIYQLPAGDAAVTLKRFSEQSGEQIVYPVDVVRGVQTNALSGELSAREALDRLVAGTELRVVQDASSGALAINRVAGSAGTGVVEGVVLNPTTGKHLERARISVDGARLEAFSDEDGRYRLSHVPAGTVKLRAFFTGLAGQVAEVKLEPGATVQHDFKLVVSPSRADSKDDAVKLSVFVVAESRQMDGAAIAINEQRFASNIKNVIAAGEFGSVADGDIGELLKLTPGITVDYAVGDARRVGLDGTPADNTPVTIGGFTLAHTVQGSTARGVELNQVSLNNVARVEVIQSPTPETPGSALAGSINFVPRSAFELTKSQLNLSAYVTASDETLSLHKTPGLRSGPSRTVLPGYEMSFTCP